MSIKQVLQIKTYTVTTTIYPTHTLMSIRVRDVWCSQSNLKWAGKFHTESRARWIDFMCWPAAIVDPCPLLLSRELRPGDKGSTYSSTLLNYGTLITPVPIHSGEGNRLLIPKNKLIVGVKYEYVPTSTAILYFSSKLPRSRIQRSTTHYSLRPQSQPIRTMAEAGGDGKGTHPHPNDSNPYQPHLQVHAGSATPFPPFHQSSNTPKTSHPK